MTKVLKTYDPNGEELWDYHVGVANEAMNEIHRLEWAGEPVPKELHCIKDEHDRAWRKAELSRHRTIEDYVRFHWSFLFAKAEKEGIPFPMPAFEDGATIEDVAALYDHYEDKIDRAIRAKQDSTPEGRPNGLDIFEPGQGRIVTSELRCFTDIYQPLLRIVALISYDLRPTESHICMALVPDEPEGRAGLNQLGYLFSRIHGEAISQAAQAIREHGGAEVIAAKLCELVKIGPRAFDYPIAGLLPRRMNFYQFIPAELDYREEARAEFRRVSMAYHRVSSMGGYPFQEGNSAPLDHVPPYIKHARYIERLAIPSQQPCTAFYQRAAMSFGGTG